MMPFSKFTVAVNSSMEEYTKRMEAAFASMVQLFYMVEISEKTNRVVKYGDDWSLWICLFVKQQLCITKHSDEEGNIHCFLPKSWSLC